MRVSLFFAVCVPFFLQPLSAHAQRAPEPPVVSADGTVGSSAPVRRDRGRLRVAVNRPYTQVWIDGGYVGTAPLERDLSVGVHAVRLSSPGQKPWEGSVEIAAGMLTPLRGYLRPAPDRSGAIAVVAVAGALGLAGIVSGVLSNHDRAALDADRMAGWLDNRDPRIDRGMALAGLADGMFVLSGLVMALGIYMFAHDPTLPSIARVGRRQALSVVP